MTGARGGLLRALLLLPLLAVSASAAPLAPPAPPVPAARPVTVSTARVLAQYPHDTSAFTEGLFVRDGRLFESTGYERRSFIREVELTTGKVRRQVAIPPDQFGEGIVDWGAELISLTWRGGVGHRWRLADFGKLDDFRYDGEGWGLTRTDHQLIQSDGTPVLRFLDPVTLKVVRRLTVTLNGQPVSQLNELEWVDGEILANVWHAAQIVRIDPASGRVKGIIDLTAIVRATPVHNAESVLNGIAWDRKARRLYVTGKNWPTLYRIAWPVD